MGLPAFRMVRIQLTLPSQSNYVNSPNSFLLTTQQTEAGPETAPQELILEWTSFFFGAVEREHLANQGRSTLEAIVKEGKDCLDEWETEIQTSSNPENPNPEKCER